MAAPFGFSVGDFLGAIHLVHNITTALRDTGGASSEYNLTISQLDNLEGLLRTAQSIYSADINPQQLERLQLLTRVCYIPLDRFFSKIKRLDFSLGNLATGHNDLIEKTKRVARKVQWAIQLKKALSELTSSMGLPISAINTQLSLIML